MALVIQQLHSWEVSAKEAVALQRKLAGRVNCEKLAGKVKWVAGLDCAFSGNGKRIVAVANITDIEDGRVQEVVDAVQPVSFLYIPGLLSFREAPICLEVLSQLTGKVDVILVDGQGTAHPRRLGLASHLGLCVIVPVIGCAKSRLVGEYDEPGIKKGSVSPLHHKGDVIGAVVRTRDRVKPVFVSVGNHCTLDDAVATVLGATDRFRLPEPLRFAHREVTRLRKER